MNLICKKFRALFTSSWSRYLFSGTGGHFAPAAKCHLDSQRQNFCLAKDQSFGCFRDIPSNRYLLQLLYQPAALLEKVSRKPSGHGSERSEESEAESQAAISSLGKLTASFESKAAG